MQNSKLMKDSTEMQNTIRELELKSKIKYNKKYQSLNKKYLDKVYLQQSKIVEGLTQKLKDERLL